MEKLDLSKIYKTYYSSKTTPELITVETATFIAIDGKGDPSQADFSGCVEALYAVAYSIKFMCKWDNRDFIVSKLEGLWWYNEEEYKHIVPEETPQKVPRHNWHYRLLLRMPDYVNRDQLLMAAQQVIVKKKLHKAGEIILWSRREGKAVQTLHVGPFETEPVTLKKLNEFIRDKGFQKNGKHHEIYLSDFRKTPAEKLKTILRQPVKPA